jgi:hypothetical protein
MNSEVIRRFMERMANLAEDMPSGWEDWIERSTGGFSPALFFLGLFISSVIFAAFGALGGIIGVSLFGKKKRLENAFPAAQDPGHRQP